MRVALSILIGLIMMFQAPVFGVTTTFHQIDSDTFVFEINRSDETVNYTVDNCDGTLNCLNVSYDGLFTWKPSGGDGGYLMYLNGTLYYPGGGHTKTQEAVYVVGDSVTFQSNLSDANAWIRVNQTFKFSGDIFTVEYDEIDKSTEENTYLYKFSMQRSTMADGIYQTMLSSTSDTGKPYHINFVKMNYSGFDVFNTIYVDPYLTNASKLNYDDYCNEHTSTQFLCFTDLSEYINKTDNTYNPAFDTIYMKSSKDIHNIINVTDTMRNPVSSYRDELANDIWIDKWSSHFHNNEAEMEKMFDYGTNDIFYVFNSWQKQTDGGHRHPDVLPATDVFGGDTNLISMGVSSKRRNVDFALYELYSDYHNGSDYWNESDVALLSNGRLMPVSVDVYLLKPTKVPKYSQIFSPQIHDTYHTTRSFVDVLHKTYPGESMDYDATVVGAGLWNSTYIEYLDLAEYEQKTHEGALLVEGGSGKEHYWIGYVDGNEGQLGKSPEGNESNLLVDYELYNVHPYFVSFGVGYAERFWYNKTTGITNEEALEFRATGIAFGRAGFFSKYLGYTEKLKEYYTMRPLQVQYTNISVKNIEYPNTTSSSTMVGLAEAFKYSNDFSQVHVNYSNGFEVFVNKNATVWTVNCGGTNYDLPFAGWCGSNPSEDFIGYFATIDGQDITYINSSEFEISIKHYLGEINVTNKLDNSEMYYNYNGTSRNHTFDTTYKVYDSVSNTILSDTDPTGVVNVSNDTGVRIYNMTDSTFYINMSGDYSSLEDSGNLMDVFDIVEDMQGLTTGNDIVLRDSGTVVLTDFTTATNSITFNGAEDQTLVIGDNVTIII